MSMVEQMRMCLAEAGFVEGREYDSVSDLPSGGFIILYGFERDDVKAAIDKASELVRGPIYYDAEAYSYDSWTIGDPKERKPA